MNPTPNLHAIVLAAGASRRFGSPKQLVRVRGQPLLHRTVSLATQVAGHSVTVVLGAHAEQLAPLLKHSPASVLINRQWEEGMASSLRIAISHLPAGTEAAMILLADQVAVTAMDLQRLAGSWRRQPDWLIAASYSGHTGVPAIFPHWCFSAFSELRGDTGARQVLARQADRCLRLPMPNAAIDIDTPEDLLNIETAAPEAPH